MAQLGNTHDFKKEVQRQLKMVREYAAKIPAHKVDDNNNEMNGTMFSMT